MTARFATLNPSTLLRAANPVNWWRRWRTRPPAPPAILPEYTGSNFFQRHRKKLLALLFILTWFYVAYFQLFGRFIMVQYLAPLMLIAVLIIWALPERTSAPTRTLEWLFFGFLIALIVWPDYLAIALPGLPWVTAVRLLGFPMMIVLLYALSVSTPFREEVKDILRSSSPVWPTLLGFIALCVLSIAFSDQIANTSNKVLVAIVNWLGIFVVACWVLSRDGRAMRFVYLLWGLLFFWSILAMWEVRLSHVPWAGHIPWFLAIQDDSVQKILAGSVRAATGLYRVQGKFTTPLGFSEFFALATPFVIHILLQAKSPALKISAGLTLMLALYAIIKTDSRLGVVGYLLSFLLYIVAWSAFRWRNDRNSLFGPAVTLTYPTMFVAAVAATFAIGRLRAVVWGNGAQQASTEARADQYAAGIPKILEQPWGHGLGRGADVLGYTNPSGFLTIDSYFLSTALEVGVIGFIVYFAIFGFGISNAVRTFLRSGNDERWLLAPAVIALINFIVIKSVFSQQENHPLAFMILALICAICWRTANDDRAHR